MDVRKLAVCLILPALLVACSGTEGGTATPGTVATTTVVSTVPGTTVTEPAQTSLVTTTASTAVTVRTTVVRPTTVTATVTRAPVVRSTPVHSTTRPTTVSTGWDRKPNSDGVNDDVPFPNSLPGWTMSTNWQAGPRAFSNGWTPAAGPGGETFPSTMNGCDDQRFLVRWHVQGEQVNAAWIDAAGDRHAPVTGSNGWFDLDSCGTPEFQAVASGGGIADVSVDVQQYVTS